MIDTDEYEGHTPAPWDELLSVGVEDQQGWDALLELGFNDEARLLIADAPLLKEEVKRLRRVIEDIESMIPDNHEEVSPVLSDILSECHRVLPMFNEVIE